MHRPARTVANGMAWIGVFVLIGAGFVVVDALGFPGVLILGLATTLVCVRAELSEPAPTWPVAHRDAAPFRLPAPEERAAAAAVREAAVSPLRYYRNCGAFLTLAGLIGTALQPWG